MATLVTACNRINSPPPWIERMAVTESEIPCEVGLIEQGCGEMIFISHPAVFNLKCKELLRQCFIWTSNICTPHLLLYLMELDPSGGCIYVTLFLTSDILISMQQSNISQILLYICWTQLSHSILLVSWCIVSEWSFFSFWCCKNSCHYLDQNLPTFGLHGWNKIREASKKKQGNFGTSWGWAEPSSS